MRKLIVFLILIAVSFSACEKENNKGLLDPKTPIKISAIETRTSTIDDSAMYVLEYAAFLKFRDVEMHEGALIFGLGEHYLLENGLTRDFENRKVLFSGEWIITTNPDQTIHKLGTFITDCKDVVFTVLRDSMGEILHPKDIQHETFPRKTTEDTVAYIPNAILSKAQAEIRTAYAAEDFTTCYKLFDDAFVFVPTTGAKWRAMKAAGIE